MLHMEGANINPTVPQAQPRLRWVKSDPGCTKRAVQAKMPHLMLPLDVQAKSRLLPVHRPRMSPVNSLMSRTCLGTARLMSHCFMWLHPQLQAEGDSVMQAWISCIKRAQTAPKATARCAGKQSAANSRHPASGSHRLGQVSSKSLQPVVPPTCYAPKLQVVACLWFLGKRKGVAFYWAALEMGTLQPC